MKKIKSLFQLLGIYFLLIIIYIVEFVSKDKTEW